MKFKGIFDNSNLLGPKVGSIAAQNGYRFIVDWDKDWTDRVSMQLALDEFHLTLNKQISPAIQRSLILLTRRTPSNWLTALGEHRWGNRVELFVADPPPLGVEEKDMKKVWSENFKKRDKLVSSLGVNHMIFFHSASKEVELESPRWTNSLHGELYRSRRAGKHHGVSFIQNLDGMDIINYYFTKPEPPLLG